MKSMGDNLVWAVTTKAKQTGKLISRIEKCVGVLGFFMRLPMGDDAGKVQMAAALVTASRHVLDRTSYSKFDRAKFYRSFSAADWTALLHPSRRRTRTTRS